MNIGFGNLTYHEDEFDYEGSLPPLEEGKPTEVAIILKEDLEAILKGELKLLLQTKQPMNKMLYEFGEEPPLLIDELSYTGLDKTKYKLFLDHHTYSMNHKDMIWMRYVSVDQSFVEGESF